MKDGPTGGDQAPEPTADEDRTLLEARQEALAESKRREAAYGEKADALADVLGGLAGEGEAARALRG